MTGKSPEKNLNKILELGESNKSINSQTSVKAINTETTNLETSVMKGMDIDAIDDDVIREERS